jgi:catechol 2,3-dioxygenase-like lactoylglutathione lyase family enzyme
MKITLTGITVDDQAKALEFYTEKLGFIKKEDIPMGEHRWLTVVSPEGVDGVELLLEPLGFPPAEDFQRALYEANIPCTQFESSDIGAEYERLKALGVTFRGEPKTFDNVSYVSFEDTCGNLVMLTQRLDK